MNTPLDTHELKSVVWMKIQRVLEEELDSLRKANDSIELDAVKTASLRGQIKQVKKMLNIGKPKNSFKPASA